MKKIALVLLRTLGDVVLINTLAETIKNWHGRDSHLTVYVNPEWQEIIANNPTIDCIKADYDYHKNFIGIYKLYLTTVYDEVFVAQQTSREDNNWHQFPESKNQHLYDYYLYRIGIPRKGEHVDRTIRMYPSQADEEKATEIHNSIGHPRMIVFHTTSGNPFKDLSMDSWAKVLGFLTDLGYVAVQVGLPTDKNVPGIEGTGKYVDLRGKVSINEAHCLIKKSEAFLGLDSGMSFVASATGVSTFVFYGCTIPMTSGPWGSNVHTYVSKECSVAKERNHTRCHSQCNAQQKCVDLLSADDLIAFIRDRVPKAQEVVA